MKENEYTDFAGLAEKTALRMFPEFFEDEPVTSGKEIIDEVDRIFVELEDTYAGRHRYNLRWAFAHAQTSFNTLFDEILENRIRPGLSAIHDSLDKRTDRKRTLRAFEKMIQDNERIKKRLHRRSQRFKLLSFLVSFVDIIISIALIVLISQVANLSRSFIHSSLMALLFLAFIALLKVTLDRFYIIPHVDKWGWELYRKTVLRYKLALARLTVLGASIEKMTAIHTPPLKILTRIQQAMLQEIRDR